MRFCSRFVRCEYIIPVGAVLGWLTVFGFLFFRFINSYITHTFSETSETIYINSARRLGVAEGPAASPVLSKAEIAERVESVLRNAVYLEVATTVTQEALDGAPANLIAGPGPYTLQSIMAKDAFRTRVYDRTGALIMAFSVRDGRFQEYRPLEKLRPLFEYTSRYPHGNDDTVGKTEQDCVAGGHIFSWVGVPSPNSFPQAVDMARTLRFKIDEGVQEADAVERGRECHVFRQRIPLVDETFNNPPAETIEHVVYVDKQTFLVIRWDTVQPGVRRVRLNQIVMEKEVPNGADWKISTAGMSGAEETLKE